MDKKVDYILKEIIITRSLYISSRILPAMPILAYLHPKVAIYTIREYISQIKAQSSFSSITYIEAAHISYELNIPYTIVKDAFYELKNEGFFSSLEYIDA